MIEIVLGVEREDECLKKMKTEKYLKNKEGL